MPNVYPYKNLEVNDFYMGIAENAYNHYGAVTDFKNFQGNPMPEFCDLPDTIKKAWHDAARYSYNQGQERHEAISVMMGAIPDMSDAHVARIREELDQAIKLNPL